MNRSPVRDVIFQNVLSIHCYNKNITIKDVQLKKTLFNILPIYVLTFIDFWLARLDHRVKFKPGVTQIQSPCNPVLRITTYEYRNLPPDFGTLALYDMLCCEWADRHYDRSEDSLGPDSPWV